MFYVIQPELLINSIESIGFEVFGTIHTYHVASHFRVSFQSVVQVFVNTVYH